jgi:hypothetical protein
LFAEVADEFLGFIGDAAGAHNANFDVPPFPQRRRLDRLAKPPLRRSHRRHADAGRARNPAGPNTSTLSANGSGIDNRKAHQAGAGRLALLAGVG